MDFHTSRKQQKGPILEPYDRFKKTAEGIPFGALSWLRENCRRDPFWGPKLAFRKQQNGPFWSPKLVSRKQQKGPI